MDNVFIRTLLTDKVKINPRLLSRNVKSHLLDALNDKFEEKCSHHGYIKRGSIEIFKYSLGQVQAISLNGDIRYTVNFYAEVCNPSVGSLIKAKVVNMNKFGILAESGITVDKKYIPILEIIVARNMSEDVVDFDKIKQGDVLTIEIMCKKYELNDKKISLIGRIVTDVAAAKAKIARGGSNLPVTRDETISDGEGEDDQTAGEEDDEASDIQSQDDEEDEQEDEDISDGEEDDVEKGEDEEDDDNFFTDGDGEGDPDPDPDADEDGGSDLSD